MRWLSAKALGQNSPLLGDSYDTLAQFYLAAGRSTEAERYLRKAVEARESAFGPQSEQVAQSLTRLGNLYRSQNRDSQAERVHNRANLIRSLIRQ